VGNKTQTMQHVLKMQSILVTQMYKITLGVVLLASYIQTSSE